MAASSGKISADQIVDPSAFPTLYESVEKLIALLDKSQDKIKENLIAMRSILSQKLTSTETIADLQKANAKIRDQDEALKKLKTTSKALTLEQAKLRIELQNQNKATKDAAKELLGLTTEYQRQSQSLIELRKQAQAVLLSNRENTAEGKKIIEQYTELDLRLKKVDATLGQHQRVVGDYGRHIIEVSKGIGGLAGLLGTLGEAFGIETEAVQESIRIGREALKVSRELLNIKHGEKEAEEDLGAVKEANAELTDLQTASYEEQAIATGEATAATEAQTIAIEEATVAQEESNAVWLASPLGIITAVGIAIVGVGVAIYEMGKEADLTAYELEEFKNSMSGFEKVLSITNESMIKNAENKKAIDEAYGVGKGKRGLDDEIEVLTQKEKARQLELRQTQVALAALQEISDKAYRVGNIKTQTETAEEIAKLKEKQAKLILESNDFNHNKILAEGKYQSELNKEKLKEAKNGEDFEDTLRHLQNDNIRYSYERKKAQINENFYDESKKYAGHTEILLALELKREIALQDLYKEQQDSFDKIRADYKNKDIEKVQADAKKEADLNKDPEFSPQLKADIELQKKKKELANKAHNQEIEAEEKLAEDLLKIEEDHIEKMSAAKNSAIDHDLERNQSVIDVQLALAASGKENTLQYELNKQDELEKARVREQQAQKKRAKEEEAVELALAFIKAYEKNLETMKPAQALAGATTETLTAKLLGKAIAGSALEGTENTGKAKGRGLDGKGGMLWMIHEDEGVATAKGNKKYKGAVGAINEGNLEDWAMKNIMLPNYQSSTMLSDVSKSSQVNSAINEMMVNEIREMKEILRDKPENYSNIDNLGNVTKYFVKRGMAHTIYKKTFID